MPPAMLASRRTRSLDQEALKERLHDDSRETGAVIQINPGEDLAVENQDSGAFLIQ